ncbi:antitoxin [Nakamurella endophytica]|uniref:antitoxin n=1 Tax=Nakamurella endophytica TaxID=1748367 RepID=UPI001664BB53|nr:antitoxin [Nakamurella endophytica]
MVDFGELKNKAQDLIAEHSDQVKQGIEKVGGLVGSRVGHDRVDPVEQKLSGLVDRIADGRTHGAPADPAAPATPATPSTPGDPAAPSVPVSADAPGVPPVPPVPSTPAPSTTPLVEGEDLPPVTRPSGPSAG